MKLARRRRKTRRFQYVITFVDPQQFSAAGWTLVKAPRWLLRKHMNWFTLQSQWWSMVSTAVLRIKMNIESSKVLKYGRSTFGSLSLLCADKFCPCTFLLKTQLALTANVTFTQWAESVILCATEKQNLISFLQHVLVCLYKYCGVKWSFVY